MHFCEESTCKQESVRFSQFSMAVITYGLKAMWGGMGSFQLTIVHAEGQPGQELKAGICRNTMERPQKNAASWLASLSLPSFFSHTVQYHLPRDGTTHNGQGHPLSIINQEMTYRFLPASPMEVFFSMSVSFSQMAVFYVKLT